MRPVAAPDAAEPATFPRYLRRIDRRWRSSTGSGIRYEAALVLIWYGTVPALVGWQALTSPPPAQAPFTWAAGVALVLATAAAVVLAAAAVGPVNVTPEYRAWVLSTPVDRAALIRRPTVRALLATAAVTAVVGLVIAALAGLRGGDVAGAGLLSAAVGGLAGVLAIHGQAAASHRALITGSRWAALALLVAAVPLNVATLRPLPSVLLWILAVVTIGIVAGLGPNAVRTASHIPLSRLTAGSGPVASVEIAVSDQSLGPLSSGLIRPELRRWPVLVGRRLSGVGPGSLVAVAGRLAIRNVQAAGRWLLLVAVCWLASSLFGPATWARAALALVIYLSAVGAVSGYGDTVRRFAVEPTLADRYGLDRRGARLVAMRVPVAAGVLFAAATMPSLIGAVGWWRAALAPILALLVVAYRVNQRPFEASFVVGSTYSQDLVRRFLRGPGVLLAGAFLAMAIVG